MTSPPGALHDPAVALTLDRLHREARRDVFEIARVLPFVAPAFLGLRNVDDAKLSRRMRNVYVPVSRSQGRLLYLLARSVGARRVIEFGTSFGVSTIYLAAAVRDNGGGVVIGSENEPSKHAQAVRNLEDAGLGSFVDVRLGDAMTTLADVSGPVDLVLLDGWKDLYLAILKLVAPKLRPGAIVLADNIFTFKRTLRPYSAFVQSGENGFESMTLEIADGFELSVYTQPPAPAGFLAS